MTLLDGTDASLASTNTVQTPRPGTTTENDLLTTTFTYDWAGAGLGNLTRIDGPGNNAAATRSVTFDYGANPKLGQPTQVHALTGAGAITTTFAYNAAAGLLTGAVTPDGRTMSLSYNLDHQPTRLTIGGDQTGVGYTYAFTGGPLVTSTEYDGGGNALRTTTQTLDALERPTAVQVTGTPTGQRTVVQMTYDALDRVKALTDAAGHTTSQTYLLDGTADAMQYPGGDQTKVSKYDNGPRPTEIQDLSGNMQPAQTTTLEYADPEKLLTRISPNNGTPTTFSYDTAEGWLNAFTNTEGTVSATHSLFGDALGETTNYGAGDKTISYTYYPDGSRATAALPDGSTWTYLYDAVGRLVQLDDAKGGRATRTTAWTYSDDGLITRRELRADGDVTAYTTYAYNAKGQLTQQSNYRHADPTDVLLSAYSNIVYDGLGRLVSMDTAIPALPAYSGAQSYAYDFLDELTQDQLASGQPHNFTFAYDNAGNPTGFKGDTHTYNANNQLTDAGFTYDAKGNPTVYRGTDLAFTPDDRLAAFGAIMSAGYRGDGLRAWKETTEGRSYYVYDGDTLVAHLDATGAVTATDVWGADGLISHGNTFYLYDPLGNVAHRLNPDGTVIANDLYDAWGTLIVCKTPAGDDYVPANSDVYGYKGQAGYVTDRETGLILCTHRYYDPGIGRWVTRDKIGYFGGINVYEYCNNCPNTRNDNSGNLTDSMKPGILNQLLKSGNDFYYEEWDWGVYGYGIYLTKYGDILYSHALGTTGMGVSMTNGVVLKCSATGTYYRPRLLSRNDLNNIIIGPSFNASGSFLAVYALSGTGSGLLQMKGGAIAARGLSFSLSMSFLKPTKPNNVDNKYYWNKPSKYFDPHQTYIGPANQTYIGPQ